ncbi:MAG: hypothetical protein PUH11_03190 [Bacilli bacterium]|nr:hypothetical protein [Bacilli bacterium]
MHTASKVFGSSDIDSNKKIIKEFTLKDTNDTGKGLTFKSTLTFATGMYYLTYDNGVGLHIGSGKNTIESINFSSTFDASSIVIKSISVECKTAKDSDVILTIEDDSTKYVNNEIETATLTTTSTSYTFTNPNSSSNGLLAINFDCQTPKSATYIKGISIKYTVSESSLCSVTFMNGETVFDTKYVASGSKVTAPTSIPTKDDYNCYTYSFDTWKLEDGTAYDFGSTVTSDTVLYSSFVENIKSTKELLDQSYKTSSIAFSYKYERTEGIQNVAIDLPNPNDGVKKQDYFVFNNLTKDGTSPNCYYKFNGSNSSSTLTHIYTSAYSTLNIEFNYSSTSSGSSSFSTLYLDLINENQEVIERVASYEPTKAVSNEPVSLSLDNLAEKNVYGFKISTTKYSGSNASVKDLKISGTAFSTNALTIREVSDFNVQYTGSTGLVENGKLTKYEDLSNFEKIGVLVTTDSSLISSETSELPTENVYTHEFSKDVLTYNCGLKISNSDIKTNYETQYYFATYALKDGMYYYSAPLTTSIKEQLSNRDLISSELENAIKNYFEIA